MSPPFDSSDGMHGDERFGNDPLSIDDRMIESMLEGTEPENPVPEAYAKVAEMLANLSSAPVDITGQEKQLASIQTALQSGITQLPTTEPTRKRRMIGNIVGLKIAIVATGAVLSAGSVAAAATGNLPAPAQNAVAHTVEHVGLDLPKAETTTTTTKPSTTSTTVVHPGADACHEAQEKDGAHGCSDLAHQFAPGQQKKNDESSTTLAKKPDAEHGKEPEHHGNGSLPPKSGDDGDKKPTTTTPHVEKSTTTTTKVESTTTTIHHEETHDSTTTSTAVRK